MDHLPDQPFHRRPAEGGGPPPQQAGEVFGYRTLTLSPQLTGDSERLENMPAACFQLRMPTSQVAAATEGLAFGLIV